MKKNKTAMERLPLFEMVVNDNENDETGIRYVSIVENPAIEIQGHIFKNGKLGNSGQSDAVGYEPPCHDNCQCTLGIDDEWYLGDNPCEFCLNNKQFYDDKNLRFNKQRFNASGNLVFSGVAIKDKQIIAAPAMIPHKEIYRNDENGEYLVRFSPDTIQSAVEKFVRDNSNRAINLEHSNTMVKAFIMEHWIVKDSVYDTSNVYGFSNLPVGTWFVVMKIEDPEFWEQQVKGENKKSFSIEGLIGKKLVKMSENTDLESVTPEQLYQLLKRYYSETKKV